jgi:hypothetical protein
MVRAIEEELIALIAELADECDELRNTLSRPLPACVVRARALLESVTEPAPPARPTRTGTPTRKQSP